MILSETDRRALVEDGYLVFRGLVARARVDAALAVINQSLGERGMAEDALATMRATTFCPELAGAAPILDLYTATPLASAVEAALGRGRVRPPASAQIALRFPDPPARRAPGRPHIDGLPRPLNGVAPGTIYHFSALAAVFLSDVGAPSRGNFTVWPGTHRALAEYFAGSGLDGLEHGFPPIPLPEPRELTVEPGDALLAHYLLAHGVAPNLGPDVRYAVFFRLFHVAHDPASTAALTDLWREWEGLDEPRRPQESR